MDPFLQRRINRLCIHTTQMPRKCCCTPTSATPTARVRSGTKFARSKLVFQYSTCVALTAIISFSPFLWHVPPIPSLGDQIKKRIEREPRGAGTILPSSFDSPTSVRSSGFVRVPTSGASCLRFNKFLRFNYTALQHSNRFLRGRGRLFFSTRKILDSTGVFRP